MWCLFDRPEGGSRTRTGWTRPRRPGATNSILRRPGRTGPEDAPAPAQAGDGSGPGKNHCYPALNPSSSPGLSHSYSEDPNPEPNDGFGRRAFEREPRLLAVAARILFHHLLPSFFDCSHSPAIQQFHIHCQNSSYQFTQDGRIKKMNGACQTLDQLRLFHFTRSTRSLSRNPSPLDGFSACQTTWRQW